MTSENIEITIKNACIYDYKNKINGDKKDILISGGKIVEKLNNQQNSLVIDGNEQIIFPGGIDLHTHFFAPETNFIRAKALNEQNMTSLPIYNEIQNSYLNHGFTFLSEMDVPMTQAKLTQINMNEVPLIDHALIMDFGSNWTFASDFQEKNNQNNIACIISKLLADLKGYGISINNPYHQQFWKLINPIPDNPEKIPLFNIKVEKIFTDFTEACKINQIKTIPFISPYNIENIEQENNHISLLTKLLINKIHLSQANHYFLNDPLSLVKLYLSNDNLEIDVTPFIENQNRSLITRDRNLAIEESKKSGIPVTTVDLEFDTEYYITTRKVSATNNSIKKITSSALEIILKLKEKDKLDRISLSSNSPYNMNITDLPQVYCWLLNSTSRKQYTSLETNLEIIDICGLISANPAKALGLSDRKGHLGVDADADIILYPINPEIISNSGEEATENIMNGFSNASVIIKNGHLIKKNNTSIIENSNKNYNIGKIFWNQGIYDEKIMEKVMKFKTSFFNKHFSMYMDSLENEEMENMEEIK